MLYETRRFMFTVSLCAMLAVNPVLATAPSEEEPLGTGHDVYVESTNSGADGAPLNLAGGIAGVTYVNRMVNTAGNAAQAAENHAAAAGAAAVSAGTAADAAQKSADAAQESADAAQESADAAQQVLTTKLDKGQGTENANRVMIVGADGNLTPGMVGMANIGEGAIKAPAIADSSIHVWHLVGYSGGTFTSGLVSVDNMGKFRFGQAMYSDIVDASGSSGGRFLVGTDRNTIGTASIEARDISIGSGSAHDIAASGTVMISDGVSGVRWGKLPASSISSYAPGTGFMSFGTPMISDGYSGATWGMIRPNTIDPYGGGYGMALIQGSYGGSWGQVDVYGIADSAVTTEKINDKAVTTDKINDAAVTADKIADKTITADQIADKTITADKFSIGENRASYTGLYLGANGNDGDVAWQYITLESLRVIHNPGTDYGRVPVLGRKDGYANAVLSLGQVGSAGIADGAVTALHISSAGVTPGLSLVAGADGVVGWKQIGSVGIANGAITTDKIADKNVTPAKIADNAVTAEKLADGVFTTDKIADSAVITEKLADNAVVTAKIADSAVTTAKINDKAVTAEKLADGVFTTDKIADSAVITEKLADNAVVTAKIADSAVTTAKIADKNVTTAKIADKAVTAEKLADGILSAKVDIAQGEANANRVMVTDASGNVVTTDVLSSDVLPVATMENQQMGAVKMASVDDFEALLSGEMSEEVAIGTVPNTAFMTEYVGEKDYELYEQIAEEFSEGFSEMQDSFIQKPSYDTKGVLVNDGKGNTTWGVLTSEDIADKAVTDKKISSYGYSGNAQVNMPAGRVMVADGNGGVTWGQVPSAGIRPGAVTEASLGVDVMKRFETKLDVAQGTENANRVMIVGADGNLTPGMVDKENIADGAVTPAQTAGVVGAIPWGSADSTTYGQFWIE